MMAILDMRREQNMAALERANEVRMARARMHRAVRCVPFGQARVLSAEMLERMPSELRLETLPVARFLSWIPQVGQDRTTRMLRAANVGDPRRAIGALSPRQRSLLAEVLRGRRP